MAHKHATQGKNKRRSAVKKRGKVLARAAQSSYNSLLSKAKEATQSLVDATAVLVLAPKIFNVRPLIESGQIDASKLRAQDLLVHGKEIVANYEELTAASKRIRDEAIDFIDNTASKINVNSTDAGVLFDINSNLLTIHVNCEQWLIDFNAKVHAPLMSAMVILNEAIIGNKVDLDSALAVTNALKQLTEEPKVEDNV